MRQVCNRNMRQGPCEKAKVHLVILQFIMPEVSNFRLIIFSIVLHISEIEPSTSSRVFLRIIDASRCMVQVQSATNKDLASDVNDKSGFVFPRVVLKQW